MIVLLLAVVVAIILGGLIYIAIDFDKTKKESANAMSALSATDLRLQSEYNRALASFASNVKANDTTLAQNTAALKARLDDPLLSTSNQEMLKTVATNPLLGASNQTALKKYYDSPLSFSSNLMQLKRSGAVFFNPIELATANDSNITLEMLQKVSFLSGLNAKELDDTNPAEFCYKSTGQCTRIGSNLNINQNMWVDAPLGFKSSQKISFRDDLNGTDLASVSYNSDLGTTHIPKLSTKQVSMTGNQATGKNVDIYTTGEGAAVVLGDTAKLHIASKVSNTSLQPILSVEKAADGKVIVSSGSAAPIVFDGNVEVRGTFKLRDTMAMDNSLPAVSSLSAVTLL